jgi:hypothetical protein
MADITKIRFIDIDAREKTARQNLEFDYQKLTARKDKNGALSDPDKLELKRLEGLIKALKAHGSSIYLDPLFLCTRAELASEASGLSPVIIEHEAGILSFKVDGKAVTADKAKHNTARTALILGLLQLNRAPLPTVKVDMRPPNSGGNGKAQDGGKHKADSVTKGRTGGTGDGKAEGKIVGDDFHPNAPLFKEALFHAIGRAAGHRDLAQEALERFVEAVGADDNDEAGVSSLEYARVFTKLIEQGIPDSDPNLKRRVEENLDQVQEIGETRPLHEFDINLPDLEATTAFEVVADHCKLMGSFIFASAFEELKAFQVVDKLIEMSQRGELPLIRGTAGTQLYSYWRDAPNRMREDERQTFYAMTLGLPTGQPGVAVNSDFQDLWLRFVSSVSSLVRESRVDQLLRSALPAAINQQQVKKAARDLAVNMSSRGYGMVFYAAADLQKQINEMITLLQDPELRAAFGARDMWGVIDQVAQTELGGARNSSKYRMLATSGAIITSWMAKNVDRLRDPTLPMVDLREVENLPSRASGQTAVSDPTDYDLVNACEMWLADSAMGEDRVEQMSQPRDSPQQTSRPIQIPSIARDLLEGAGLGLGVGMGVRGNGNGHSNGRGGSRYGF